VNEATPRRSLGPITTSTVAVLGLFLVLLLLSLARLAVAGPGERTAAAIGSPLAVSLAAASIATVLALFLGVPAALWLARARFRGRDLLTTLLDLPTMLSPIAIGTALLLFLRDPPGAWLDGAFDLTFAFGGIVLAQFTVVTALVVRAAEAAFAGVDTRLESLAELFGASRTRVFWRVTLPLARPGLGAAAVLAFARALGEFGATVTVAGTIPGRTETLATGIFLALGAGELALAARLALILAAVAGSVLLVVRRLLRETR
jgi:molybdate transport system permease protein